MVRSAAGTQPTQTQQVQSMMQQQAACPATAMPQDLGLRWVLRQQTNHAAIPPRPSASVVLTHCNVALICVCRLPLLQRDCAVHCAGRVLRWSRPEGVRGRCTVPCLAAGLVPAAGCSCTAGCKLQETFLRLKIYAARRMSHRPNVLHDFGTLACPPHRSVR